MVKISQLFIQFVLTIFLLQSVRSIKEDFEGTLKLMCSKLGNAQAIASFEDLINFYKAIYPKLYDEVKEQFVIMHNVRGSTDPMKNKNTITYGAMVNRETTNDEKASLLFTLIASANLLGIFEPPTAPNTENVLVHQIRMICESFALANQAESGFEHATDVSEEQKTDALRQLIKFTALTSTVGYEDVMGIGGRSLRNGKYLTLFKQNWQIFRQLLAKSSNLVKEMDALVASDFADLQVSYTMNDYLKISGLLGRIIYERAFHEEMSESDLNIYEQNRYALYEYKTTKSFSVTFLPKFNEAAQALDENASVDDMNQFFYDLAKDTNREMNQSVSYAYATLITLGRSGIDQEDFKKYFFSHVFRLILLEEYFALKVEMDKAIAGNEDLKIDNGITILGTPEYTDINLLNQSFQFAYEFYTTSYDICVDSPKAIAERLKGIITEPNSVLDKLSEWTTNFNKNTVYMTGGSSPTNDLRDPGNEIEVSYPSTYPDRYFSYIDGKVPGFSAIMNAKINDLKSEYRNQQTQQTQQQAGGEIELRAII